MTATQLPPPGWYADPEHADRERYWSGDAWSDDRRPRTAAAPTDIAPTDIAPTDIAPPMKRPAVRPIRNDADFFVQAGHKRRSGRLLLYPDRVVHVDSKLPQHIGLIPLLLVQWVCRWIAKVRAARRVAAGDTRVVTIPLTVVARVQTHGPKLAESLVIVTATGAMYWFSGVRCDKWMAELSSASTAAGRTVSPGDGGFTVA